MTQKEFNKRCHEVFLAREGDEFYYVEEVFSDDRILIAMSEIDDDGERNTFYYEAYMIERPESLAYLLGERDDFTD